VTGDVKDGDVVASFDVTTNVQIRAWHEGIDEDLVMYDWVDSSGRESDQLFYSIEEAREDYPQ
jgi:hypothetical protein